MTITSAQGSPAPGDWRQVELRSGSVSNLFQHVLISYGGGAGFGQLRIYEGITATLDNVVFSESADGCDIVNHGTLDATDSTYVICP